MLDIPWLRMDDVRFPAPTTALKEPNGLLAVGGDLSPQRLLQAYAAGIFPWYEAGQPILWWSPDPRMVLRPQDVHIARSLGRFIRSCPYTITMDKAFTEVMQHCASSRMAVSGTWITDEMQQAYTRMHNLGHAHSVEIWHEQSLVGGLYGIALNNIFFGESMFSLAANTSKIAFVCLCRQLESWAFRLVDCQLPTAHLRSLGASEMPRREFLQELQLSAGCPVPARNWVFPDHKPNTLLMRRK
ncbi:MAG: leucyl/phenylalanyl-tRNA--protein transferase [Pseudomonadales bacterium]|nr:leucyl/phenylalanyl-tRNA--protein transferase [Pseudomonadales bacterium]